MVDQKIEPVTVSLEDGQSASPSSVPVATDDVKPASSSSDARLSVRKELLDAVVVQQQERISQLERQVEKKRARVEQFSAQPPPFLHPSALCVMPPGHPGAATPSAAAQKVMHPPSTVGSAVPKTGTAGSQSQPPSVHHPVMAAAMAAAAAAGSPHVSGALPAQYPFVYAPPDHPAMAAASLVGVLPHGPTPPPPPPQPPATPQTPQPTQSSDGDRKQSRYWTPDEHQRFLAAVNTCGPKNYHQISEFVGTRNAKQVRTHAQKFQQRLEREEAKRRNEMGLSGLERGGSTEGAAAAAIEAAAAAKAMHGNVPGASSSGTHRDGSRAYGGPTSSSSGKNFSRHDNRDQTRSSIDGSSSTNDLSGSGSGSGERNRTNDSDNTGDHSASNAASAAAMAAVAAEAAALGGGILQRGGIPGVVAKKTGLATKPKTQSNGTNPKHHSNGPKVDVQTGGKSESILQQHPKSDARSSSVGELDSTQESKPGSQKAVSPPKAPTSGSQTSTQNTVRKIKEQRQSPEKNDNKQAPPPKVRFKAAVLIGRADDNVENINGTSADVTKKTSPSTYTNRPHMGSRDSSMGSSKSEQEAPVPPQGPTAEKRESDKLPSKANKLAASSPSRVESTSGPRCGARKQEAGPISEAKEVCSSVQKRILAKYNDQTTRSLGSTPKSVASNAELSAGETTPKPVPSPERCNSREVKGRIPSTSADHKSVPERLLGDNAELGHKTAVSGNVCARKPEPINVTDSVTLPASRQTERDKADALMSDGQREEDKGNASPSRSCDIAVRSTREEAKDPISNSGTDGSNTRSEVNGMRKKQERETQSTGAELRNTDAKAWVHVSGNSGDVLPNQKLDDSENDKGQAGGIRKGSGSVTDGHEAKAGSEVKAGLAHGAGLSRGHGVEKENGECGPVSLADASSNKTANVSGSSDKIREKTVGAKQNKRTLEDDLETKSGKPRQRQEGAKTGDMKDCGTVDTQCAPATQETKPEVEAASATGGRKRRAESMMEAGKRQGDEEEGGCRRDKRTRTSGTDVKEVGTVQGEMTGLSEGVGLKDRGSSGK